jgi:hypothetical protein
MVTILLLHGKAGARAEESPRLSAGPRKGGEFSQVRRAGRWVRNAHWWRRADPRSRAPLSPARKCTPRPAATTPHAAPSIAREPLLSPAAPDTVRSLTDASLEEKRSFLLGFFKRRHFIFHPQSALPETQRGAGPYKRAWASRGLAPRGRVSSCHEFQARHRPAGVRPTLATTPAGRTLPKHS